MRSVTKKLLALTIATIMLVSFATVAFADAFNQEYETKEDGTQTITRYTEYVDPDDPEAGIVELENGVLELEGTLDFGPIQLVFTGVSDEAFAYEELVISDYVTFLGTIKELVVGKNIVDIGKSAFAKLPALTKVTFKDDVKIDENAFLDCTSLETVVFEGKADLGENAFAGCTALTSVSFASECKASDTAFAGCTALADISVPENVIFGGSAKTIADTAFYKNFNVDFVTINSTLVAYKGNDYEVTVPENITVIGKSAFEGNKNLTTVNFTKYIDTVCDRAFFGCKKLENINYAPNGKIKNVGDDIFTNTAYFDNFDGDFFIVEDVLVKYLGEDDIVYVPVCVNSVKDDAFDGCYSAKTPDGYTWVVSAIYVPSLLENIGEHSFALAQLDDGTYYVPRIYAYAGSASAKALADKGYTVTARPVKADLDKDGMITAADARLALRYAVKLDIADENTQNSCDVDFDNAVTAADARIILRMAVGLDASPDTLANAPVSKFDILNVYTEAMAKLASSGAGYTKTVSNKMTGKDMSSAGVVNMYKTISKTGIKNETVVYAPDTAEAAANVDLCKLVSTKDIKNATCEIRDGKYNITITFNDVLDNSGKSDIAKLFPVTPCTEYTKAFSGKNWWKPVTDNDYHVNGIKKFDLTYTEPTVTVVCDKDTLEISECTLSCGYLFTIDGFINMLPVSSELYKNEEATVTRLDTVTYSDFVYRNEA